MDAEKRAENERQLAASVRRIRTGTGLRVDDTERDPCECPYCGSAASYACIELLVKLDGYDGHFAQCSLTVPDPERNSSDYDSAPAVTTLICDDCDGEFKPDARMFVELRITTCFG